jgi:hypothetical protein
MYVVVDEKHMLLVCPLYSNLRQNTVSISVLATCNETALFRLAAFVYHAFELRTNSDVFNL